MSDSKINKPVAIAMGASFVAAMSAAPIANADTNPFGMQQLESGYLQLAGGHEGKCGEGKCGEGKCGEGKCGEGKCGGDKGKEGKCGEGKCGEGKCGGKG